MTLLKYLFVSPKIDKKLFINPKRISRPSKSPETQEDRYHRQGATGGKPVGKTLADAKINFVSTNTQTTNPTEYYRRRTSL
jgi:hypothetical protein